MSSKEHNRLSQVAYTEGGGGGGGGGGFFSKESIWLSLLDFVVFPHRNYLVCFYRSTCIVELHPEKFISA